MIVYAHLGHWYSALGFIVPACLVVAWIQLQSRREQRQKEFVEYWTLELRDGEWVVISMKNAPPERRRHMGTRTPSPWVAAGARTGLPPTPRQSSAASARPSATNGSKSSTNGKSG
jgi:hypothetical protein